MKVLLYGMQSSGASVIAYTLAQKPGSLAFVDIWNMFAAPVIDATDEDVVAKVVVTTAFSLELHRQRFRPDITALILRHPIDTYDSLFGKSYANECGLMDEKFALQDEVFRSGLGFDHILYYEDFVFCPAKIITFLNSIGWDTSFESLLFKRTQRDIQDTNIAALPELHKQLKYGYGNVQAKSVLRDRVRFSQPWGKTAHLPSVCPALFDHYSAMQTERGELWHVPSPALLSCNLHRVLRELTGSESIPAQSERVAYKLQFINGSSQCKVTDTELLLFPARHKGKTSLAIQGLPGKPFNRIRAIAHAQHPLAAGTTLVVHVKDEKGIQIAEHRCTLRNSEMRNVDIAFSVPTATITISFIMFRAEHETSNAYAGICIQDLRLEHVAD